MLHSEDRDTFLSKSMPLWFTRQVYKFWPSHSVSVTVSMLLTLKVVGPDSLASASTGFVVKPDSTCCPSRSQDTLTCLGLNPVAWQMSRDLRGLEPEKESRGGMNTFTLGCNSMVTGVQGQDVSLAWCPQSPPSLA